MKVFWERVEVVHDWDMVVAQEVCKVATITLTEVHKSENWELKESTESNPALCIMEVQLATKCEINSLENAIRFKTPRHT